MKNKTSIIDTISDKELEEEVDSVVIIKNDIVDQVLSHTISYKGTFTEPMKSINVLELANHLFFGGKYKINGETTYNVKEEMKRILDKGVQNKQLELLRDEAYRIGELSLTVFHYFGEKITYKIEPHQFTTSNDFNQEIETIERDTYVAFIKEAVEELNMLKWKDDYTDPNVRDGWEWTLVIRLDNNTKIVKHGQNRAPRTFKKLENLFFDLSLTI